METTTQYVVTVKRTIDLKPGDLVMKGGHLRYVKALYKGEYIYTHITMDQPSAVIKWCNTIQQIDPNWKGPFITPPPSVIDECAKLYHPQYSYKGDLTFASEFHQVLIPYIPQ